MSDLFEKAHARRSDPQTSHEAAAAATLGVERQRNLVLAYAKGRAEKGFMDIDLEEAHPLESDSGLRTRRSELTARNIILDSGRRDRANGSNRKRIVWTHRDFIPNPPPERDAPPSAAQLEVTKADALAHAATLRQSATWVSRQYGLVGIAAEMNRAADLLIQMAG